MNDRHRVNVCGLILLLLWLSGPAFSGEQSPAADDWTELGGRWETQSYWQDPGILQRYTFSENANDKVVGQSSVEVHMEVGAERPNQLIELRLVPLHPLDLSKAEAIEVWLKQADGCYVFTTSRYRAVIGANGYLQSLRAGPTEFFRVERPCGPRPSTADCWGSRR